MAKRVSLADRGLKQVDSAADQFFITTKDTSTEDRTNTNTPTSINDNTEINTDNNRTSSRKIDTDTSNSTDTDTTNNSNMNSNNNTNTDSNKNSSIETNKITKVETILSTNLNTNEITIQKRLKYLEERKQRAYYIENDLIKKIDRLSKKFNIDKSDIVNESLKLFFANIDQNK
ncbi:MAG TPA: hypothetical protein VEF53_18855 [Patescibacteria group bacterium]|nr:hypothetical protein [Patescibacteria group bacterium]